MRVLGLDFGDRTVGVAISDPECRIATPLETIRREDPEALKQTIQRIRTLVTANGIDTIVLGLPRNMNGTEGPRAEKTRAFQKRLLRDVYRVTVELWDERLTTVAAERPLKELGKDRFERKEIVDSMAAALILQGYLDSLRLKKQEESKMATEERQIILYEPEEQLKTTMNVFASQEIDEEEYFLAAVAYEDEEEEFDDEDEEEDGVFIFKVCTAEESEFIVLNEDGTTDYYVTTELGDHYDTVIETFQNMSDEFDLIADDDEE